VPGKKRCLRFYFGGMELYRKELAECVEGGYKGFKPFVPDSVKESEPLSTKIETAAHEEKVDEVLTT